MPPTLALCLFLAGAPPARDGGVPGALPAAAREALGQRVMAPWGREGKRYPGQIAAVYGKFALVKFDDGDAGWSEVDLLSPPVRAAPAPGEPNPHRPGREVTVRWGRRGRLSGVVLDTYGKLTLVRFESDDRAWFTAGEVRAR